jgi:hypothetical protein
MGKAKINTAERNRVHSILKSSYNKNKDAKNDLASQGYVLDEQLSGKRAKVFTGPDGKPSIVYRGTNTIQDVGTDMLVSIGLGKYTNRVKHSKKVHDEVKQKYKTNEVDTYGHSLGGYLAENVGAKGNIVTYNKASIGGKVTNPKQTDIRTKNDVVSQFTPKHDNLVEIKGSKDPLKTHSLDILK